MTTNEIPECITIVETKVGVRRFYAKCSEHPQWRPGSSSERYSVETSPQVITHVRDSHDGIDRTGMPAQLVKALANVHDVSLRRQLARGARDWARREAADPDSDQNN